jgi:DNA-binding FrmR family transcriptional regulator
VLTQVASVTKALQGVAMGLLDEHMRHCVRDGGDDKLEEAMSAVQRLLRT